MAARILFGGTVIGGSISKPMGFVVQGKHIPMNVLTQESFKKVQDEAWQRSKGRAHLKPQFFSNTATSTTRHIFTNDVPKGACEKLFAGFWYRFFFLVIKHCYKGS